jgi:purine nucleosidase
MLVQLDTDIGGDTDDVFALAMLLRSPEVEIAGISTSTEIDGKCATMARYVMRLANNNTIPVAAGAEGEARRFSVANPSGAPGGAAVLARGT